MVQCAECGERMIPAGISKKTGKQYNSFCSSEECPSRERKQQFNKQSKPRPVPQEMAIDNAQSTIFSSIVSINSKLTKIYNAVDTLVRATGKTMTAPSGAEVLKDEPDWGEEPEVDEA